MSDDMIESHAGIGIPPFRHFGLSQSAKLSSNGAQLGGMRTPPFPHFIGRWQCQDGMEKPNLTP
jgi:hypothetical protein